MSCEIYINRLAKSHIWDINPLVYSSGDNKNKKINVETAASTQVKMLKIGSTKGDSLQLCPKCLKPKTLYDHHKIVPIPSDSIEKMYQEVGPEEGTTHH